MFNKLFIFASTASAGPTWSAACTSSAKLQRYIPLLLDHADQTTVAISLSIHESHIQPLDLLQKCSTLSTPRLCFMGTALMSCLEGSTKAMDSIYCARLVLIQPVLEKRLRMHRKVRVSPGCYQGSGRAGDLSSIHQLPADYCEGFHPHKADAPGFRRFMDSLAPPPKVTRAISS